MDELEKYENKSIDMNNKIEITVIDEILFDTSKDLGNSLRDIFLNKKSIEYKDKIISILDKYNYNRYDFYFDILIDLATHDDININSLINGLFIKNIKIIDDAIVLDTIDGTIKVLKLAEKINDKYLLQRKKEYNLVGCCHAITSYMIIKYGLLASTGFLSMGFDGKYLHSYNQDNFGYVYDASHNLIVEFEDYVKLTKPCVINSVSKSDLISSLEYKERYISEVEPLYSFALTKFKNK